jgi:hypothetical protein
MRIRPFGAISAGLLVAASLGVAACGASETATTILNTETVERAIEQSSLGQRKRKVDVSCPSGVHQKKGLVFSCMAKGSRGSTRFVVTELDDAGHVRYRAV